MGIAGWSPSCLRVGADTDEIVALAEHLSVYSSYPRAINMLGCIQSVFDEVGIPPAMGTDCLSLKHLVQIWQYGGGLMGEVRLIARQFGIYTA